VFGADLLALFETLPGHRSNLDLDVIIPRQQSQWLMIPCVQRVSPEFPPENPFNKGGSAVGIGRMYSVQNGGADDFLLSAG
jgi:hypothetical protein